MFPKKPVIIGRWRWRLSCLLAKAHQIPVAPTDQLHINIKHPLRQNYRRFLDKQTWNRKDFTAGHLGVEGG
jgi:hypothetical protein